MLVEGVGMSQVVIVDGETFLVRRRDLRTYDYDWVTGPHARYGFTTGSSAEVTRFSEHHEEAIRGFLAGIDPNTGFLYDD
ncbi:conserved hypothetical protein [Citricoccus sp. K5]|nr:conserved hypothetical protein [Citricoccus sp. K5]